MFKKMIIILISLFLLTSCENLANTNTDKDLNINNKETKKEDITKKEEPASIRYTGELITDGIYGEEGCLYFVPDKETRELINNKFSISFKESIPLHYHESEAIKDLPTKLGIYKVEIKPNQTNNNGFINISSIKLTDDIGTIEYEGKSYDTNKLDENIRPKDRVCGLIVAGVFIDKKYNSVQIYFTGELEVEGIYNVINGGEWHNNINIGHIFIDNEFIKNIPTYNNKTITDYTSPIFFKETNDLYKKLSDHSAVGHGKFKISDYKIIYNTATEFTPTNELIEIISLDEKTKDLFKFNENKKYIYGITDEYILVIDETITEDVLKNYPEEIKQEGPNDMSGKGAFYVIGRKNFSKIQLLHPYIYSYNWEPSKESKQESKTNFSLTSDGHNCITREIEHPHKLECKFYTGDNKSEDYIEMTKDTTTFIYKDSKE